MNSRGSWDVLIALVVIAFCASLTAQSGSAPRDPAIASAAAGAGAPDTVNPPGGKPHDNTFVIGEDDQLSINVWKEQDLSESVPVRSDGKISLPLIGDVQAAGKTPLQLEDDITARLRAYITQPEVTVMVMKINSQKFNILGRVAKPGSYALTSSMTVLDAIAAAGGFQDFARQKSIYILRQGPDGKQTRLSFNYKDVVKGKDPDQNVKLQPHDTIIVP